MPTQTHKLLREPLLHFTLLAILLFLVDHFVSQSSKEQIVISTTTADYLVKQREDLELRKLSDKEREETIAAYIEDEILYNEAYKRGLDRGDSRIRRNLILKMRGLLAGEIEDPDEATLRAWYADNLQRFTRSESWSLQQVFFSHGNEVPGDLVARLNAGLDPTAIGEQQLGIRRSMQQATRRDLVGMLGPDAARSLLTVSDKSWHGPYESPYGMHFIRITGYTPETQQSYESVKHYLSGDWLLAQTRQSI